MEFFSEIYGDSYRAVAAVLTRAAASPVSEQDIARTVEQYTSGENALYIVPRLTSGDWPLLSRTPDGLFAPVTKRASSLPLTGLQRAWLTAMLSDRRCAAFFDEEERKQIADALDSQPLYDCAAVESVGVSTDGDHYSDPEYARRLSVLMNAIRSRTVLSILYTGGKGKPIRGDFLPCRLEYSSKDDKLRLFALRIRYGKPIFHAVINLGRIEGIRPSNEQFEGEVDIDQWLLDSRRPEPAVVELVDVRNALERFMLQFAGYEKRTRYLDEEDKYICSIYYDTAEETELLIRLLSFGPVIKLISPAPLVESMRERINRQWELLTAVETSGEDGE